MIKTSILASAIWLGFATMAMAQSTAPGTPKSPASALQRCEGMTGTALEQCKREAAPGKSEDAASRAGGASPGASGNAASRTGTPPSGVGSTLDKGKK